MIFVYRERRKKDVETPTEKEDENCSFFPFFVLFSILILHRKNRFHEILSLKGKVDLQWFSLHLLSANARVKYFRVKL